MDVRARRGRVIPIRLSVIGGGYVGLVYSVCLAELGHQVDLVEIDEEKVKAINSGAPPIYEKGLKEMLTAHAGNRLKATDSYDCIPDTDITFICVGTPPDSDGRADLSMLRSASISIGEALMGADGYHIVVVKSTVPPGTTGGLVAAEVLDHSAKGKDDIGFAMNPEFLREGLAVQDFMNPDRIVIGSEVERVGDVVEGVYQGLGAPVLSTSLMVAEMIKYASNAFLASKISFSNEIGNICKRLGIDVYDVMKGVGMDSRISPHFLNAGAGFGGSCFPKDVAALIHFAEEIGEDPVILKSVLEVNDRQPLKMVDLLEDKLGNLKGKRIAILGLAFKDETDDVRDSRSISAIEELRRRGAEVAAYDPLANSSMSRTFPQIDYYGSAAEALRSADGCLVMTEWPEFRDLDNEFDLMRSRVIIEGRKILNCRGADGICW